MRTLAFTFAVLALIGTFIAVTAIFLAQPVP